LVDDDSAIRFHVQRRQWLVTQVENVEINQSIEDASEPNQSEPTVAAAQEVPMESEALQVSAEETACADAPAAIGDDEPASVEATVALDETPESAVPAVTAEPTEPEVIAAEANASVAAPETDESTVDSVAETEPTEAVEAPAETTTVEESTHTPEERIESLEAEVNAAPHKVYSLGKVRRVLAELKKSETEESLVARLVALEASILAQIAERKAAKENICERAEELRDSNEWRATGDKMRALFEEWKLIGGAGKKLDDELWQRFIAAREHFSKRRTEHFEERQKVWAVAKEKKEALIAQAEALGTSTEWRSTADKIRNLQDQWKQAGSAGRDADDALWNRFNAAKQAFFDNRTAVWDANKQQKEALCLEAEALKESSDWRLTGDAMKAMQARWKEIGSAGKAAEDKLRERFRAATNAFFERREGAFAGKRQDERENLAKKQDLVAKIEALVYTSDGLSAAREARDLQAQWKAVGHASREQSDALWVRFRAACDKIFESASSERDRQQTEWHGRMKDAMTRKREQLASTRESIEHDEANLERWRATLSELRPGGNTREIEANLDSKILDVINRIRAKQARVEELRATITDMEAKLRD
jgi:hypothetical protein